MTVVARQAPARREVEAPVVEAAREHAVVDAGSFRDDVRLRGRELLLVRAQDAEPKLVLRADLGLGDAQPDDEGEVRMPERERPTADPRDPSPMTANFCPGVASAASARNAYSISGMRA